MLIEVAAYALRNRLRPPLDTTLQLDRAGRYSHTGSVHKSGGTMQVQRVSPVAGAQLGLHPRRATAGVISELKLCRVLYHNLLCLHLGMHAARKPVIIAGMQAGGVVEQRHSQRSVSVTVSVAVSVTVSVNFTVGNADFCVCT